MKALVAELRCAAQRGAFGLVLAALGLPGCQAPQPQSNLRDVRVMGGDGAKVKPPPPIEAGQVGTRDDVVSIHQFWKPLPWRMVEDRAVGFSVPTYFISAETEKGVFVSGKILVWLYEILRQADGPAEKQCVHVWEFDRAAALGYRVRKLGIMGYYYGFALTWPPNIDIAGREVEIVFGYERGDGQVVTGMPRRLRVPAPSGRGFAGRSPAPQPAGASSGLRPPGRRELSAPPELEERVRARLRELDEPADPGGAAAPHRTGD